MTAIESTSVDDLMADLIDGAIPDGDFVPAVVTEKVLALLLETNPALLEEWLHEHAAVFITQFITARLGRYRRRALAQAKAVSFSDAAKAAEAGDLEPVSLFLAVHYVDDKNTRRRVADMTGDDHLFVADCYAAAANDRLMLDAFHRAVAKKVGRKRTADVMTEEKYHELYRSVCGG